MNEPFLNKDQKNQLFSGFNLFLNIECWILRFFVVLLFLGILAAIGVFASYKSKECYKVTGTVVSYQQITRVVTVSYIDPTTGAKVTKQIQANYNYTRVVGSDIYLYINKKRSSDVSDLQPLTALTKIVVISMLAFAGVLFGILLYYIFKNKDVCKALSMVSLFNGFFNTGGGGSSDYEPIEGSGQGDYFF